jgi:hypothetical protein
MKEAICTLQLSDKDDFITIRNLTAFEVKTTSKHKFTL